MVKSSFLLLVKIWEYRQVLSVKVLIRTLEPEMEKQFCSEIQLNYFTNQNSRIHCEKDEMF